METPEQVFNRLELYVDDTLNFYFSVIFNELTVSDLFYNRNWSHKDILDLFFVFQYAVSIENGVLSETPEHSRFILAMQRFKIPGILDNLKEKTMSLPFKNEQSRQIMLMLFSEINEDIIINLNMAEYKDNEDVLLSGELPLDQRLVIGAENAIDLTDDGAAASPYQPSSPSNNLSTPDRAMKQQSGDPFSPFRFGGKGRKKRKTKKYKSKKSNVRKGKTKRR